MFPFLYREYYKNFLPKIQQGFIPYLLLYIIRARQDHNLFNIFDFTGI